MKNTLDYLYEKDKSPVIDTNFYSITNKETKDTPYSVICSRTDIKTNESK